MSEHACPTCEDTFDSERALKIHHTQAHGDRLGDDTCAHCGETVTRPEHQYCSHECSASARREQVTVTCAHCDTEFDVDPCEAADRRYCSTDCSAAAQRASVTLTCQECADEFDVAPSKADGRQFCSKPCQYAAQENQVSLTCDHCDDTFSVKESRADGRRFCSHVCQAESSKNRVTLRCEHCDDPFRVPRGGTGHRSHCSDACRVAAIREAADGPPTHFCDACGRAFESYKDRRFCSRACTAEHRRETQRPDDIDAHIHELYVEDGHSFNVTWRRLTAARDDHPPKTEVRERLKEMGVYNTSLADKIRSGEVTVETATEAPAGDDSWRDYYQRGESDD